MIKKIIVILLATIMCLSLCSCKKKVKIIQNTKPDDNKKQVTSAPVPTADKSPVTIEFGDTHLKIKSPYQEVQMPYELIKEYMFMSEWDYESDELKDGTDDPAYICGKMMTQDSEEYVLTIYKSVNKYIAVYCMNVQYVFNLESVEETQKAYDLLKQHIEGK